MPVSAERQIVSRGEDGQEQRDTTPLFTIPLKTGSYETPVGAVTVTVCPPRERGDQKIILGGDLFKYEPPPRPYQQKKGKEKAGRRVVIFSQDKKKKDEPIVQATKKPDEFLVFQRKPDKKRRKKERGNKV